MVFTSAIKPLNKCVLESFATTTQKKIKKSQRTHNRKEQQQKHI